MEPERAERVSHQKIDPTLPGSGADVNATQCTAKDRGTYKGTESDLAGVGRVLQTRPRPKALRRVAGRVRDSGGVLQGGDLDATRSTCEALRRPECLGVLHSVAGGVRPCGRGAISEDGEPRASAGAGSAAELLGALEEWRPARVRTRLKEAHHAR